MRNRKFPPGTIVNVENDFGAILRNAVSEPSDKIIPVYFAVDIKHMTFQVVDTVTRVDSSGYGSVEWCKLLTPRGFGWVLEEYLVKVIAPIEG